jgi:acetylornithine deacetylase/succinyl-diaminopimelate desuccinylase-like protein
MGPGETERSHRPDEYITLQELEDALYGYQQLLDAYFNILDTQK